MINLHSILDNDIPPEIKLLGIWFRKHFPNSTVRFIRKNYKNNGSCIEYNLEKGDAFAGPYNSGMWIAIAIASKYEVSEFTPDMIEII